jgi:hypothetical protein
MTFCKFCKLAWLALALALPALAQTLYSGQLTQNLTSGVVTLANPVFYPEHHTKPQQTCGPQGLSPADNNVTFRKFSKLGCLSWLTTVF